MLNRKHNRLAEFDYSQTGYYFVTICTHNMISYFGKIFRGKMILNNCGQIAQTKLLELQKRYNYVEIDQFVVMPNHVHVIIIIDSYKPKDKKRIGGDLPLRHLEKIKSLSELVGVFKTTSSKNIHQNGLQGFKWQRSFYDRIIRNDDELFKIRKYIELNPLKWEIEKGNIENLDI